MYREHVCQAPVFHSRRHGRSGPTPLGRLSASGRRRSSSCRSPASCAQDANARNFPIGQTRVRRTRSLERAGYWRDWHQQRHREFRTPMRSPVAPPVGFTPRRTKTVVGRWAVGALLNRKTAVAISALVGSRGACDSVTLDMAIRRGVAWMIKTTLGLYFARLWYAEELYPLIFAAGALESPAGRASIQHADRCRRHPSTAPFSARSLALCALLQSRHATIQPAVRFS